MDVLGAVRDIIVAVAAIVTAYAAWRGVSEWQKQLRGQTEYQTARLVLHTTYKVRSAISMVRSPFMSAGEMTSGVHELDPEAKDLPPKSDEAQSRRLAAGYGKRWQPLADAMEELATARYEAEAIWGPAAAVCLNDVKGCAVELGSSIQMYLLRERDGFYPPVSDDFDKKVQAVVFGGGGEADDEFSVKIRQAFESVEAFYRPKLK